LSVYTGTPPTTRGWGTGGTDVRRAHANAVDGLIKHVSTEFAEGVEGLASSVEKLEKSLAQVRAR
jgi:hypothetical protein